MMTDTANREESKADEVYYVRVIFDIKETEEMRRRLEFNAKEDAR